MRKKLNGLRSSVSLIRVIKRKVRETSLYRKVSVYMQSTNYSNRIMIEHFSSIGLRKEMIVSTMKQRNEKVTEKISWRFTFCMFRNALHITSKYECRKKFWWVTGATAREIQLKENKRFLLHQEKQRSSH